MRKTKNFTLLSGTEEGWQWGIKVCVVPSGHFHGKGTFRYHNSNGETEDRRRKETLRKQDRTWCYQNIPSSIMWFVQIHHDWDDGDRMYLLTKAEHILRHRGKK